MDNRFNYFLLVAEELNMSRAAERAFISHQGISNAIKQLETEYNVRLFYRTPTLKLTPEGQTLVNGLRQIKLIEDNLAAEMNDDSNEYKGHIQLGIPTSRYDLFVPDIVPYFKRLYPDVEIEIISDYSEALKQKAKNNELDMCIATGISNDLQLTMTPLIQEHFVLLISHDLLCRYFPGITEQEIKQFHHGVRLEDFARVPLIRYPAYSRLRHAIDRYAEENNISLNPVFESNNAMSFGKLCRRYLGMSIVSHLFISNVEQMNRDSTTSEYVHAFPLLDISYCKNVTLVYNSSRYFNRCHQALIRHIIDLFDNYNRTVPSWL